MTETEDYKSKGYGPETQDYQTLTPGDNIIGDDGVLVIPIPAANYPSGKTATARDSALIAANIKDGVTIFSTPGSYEGEAPTEGQCELLFPGNDVHGADGDLSFLIPEACYDGTKNATASDANLIADNIKDNVYIFGVQGSLAAASILILVSLPALSSIDESPVDIIPTALLKNASLPLISSAHVSSP